MILRLRAWGKIRFLNHDLYVEELVNELSNLRDDLFDPRIWHPALLYCCVRLANLSIAG